MTQQALVIGLGQFGMALTRSLIERNVEVLAIDISRPLVDLAAQIATEALQVDATDEAALHSLTPSQRDVVVCAIGDEAREASIVCTALLRQFGVKRLIARASDDLHARILHLVGAHVVVNPEREYGERFANRLLHHRILTEMPLSDDLHIAEMRIPAGFVGRTLQDLELPRRFGATVVAIRASQAEAVVQPDPRAPLQAGSMLLVVAREADVARLSKEA